RRGARVRAPATRRSGARRRARPKRRARGRPRRLRTPPRARRPGGRLHARGPLARDSRGVLRARRGGPVAGLRRALRLRRPSLREPPLHRGALARERPRDPRPVWTREAAYRELRARPPDPARPRARDLRRRDAPLPPRERVGPRAGRDAPRRALAALGG